LTDEATPIDISVTGAIPLTGNAPRNDSASVGIGCSANCTLKIRWRDGDQEYPAFFEELPVNAGASIVNLFRLGELRDPFRVFELGVDAAPGARLSGLVVNEAFE
jgi:hypothetical protein